MNPNIQKQFTELSEKFNQLNINLGRLVILNQFLEEIEAFKALESEINSNNLSAKMAFLADNAAEMNTLEKEIKLICSKLPQHLIPQTSAEAAQLIEQMSKALPEQHQLLEQLQQQLSKQQQISTIRHNLLGIFQQREQQLSEIEVMIVNYQKLTALHNSNQISAEQFEQVKQQLTDHLAKLSPNLPPSVQEFYNSLDQYIPRRPTTSIERADQRVISGKLVQVDRFKPEQAKLTISGCVEDFKRLNAALAASTDFDRRRAITQEFITTTSRTLSPYELHQSIRDFMSLYHSLNETSEGLRLTSQLERAEYLYDLTNPVYFLGHLFMNTSKNGKIGLTSIKKAINIYFDPVSKEFQLNEQQFTQFLNRLAQVPFYDKVAEVDFVQSFCEVLLARLFNELVTKQEADISLNENLRSDSKLSAHLSIDEVFNDLPEQIITLLNATEKHSQDIYTELVRLLIKKVRNNNIQGGFRDKQDRFNCKHIDRSRAVGSDANRQLVFKKLIDSLNILFAESDLTSRNGKLRQSDLSASILQAIKVSPHAKALSTGTSAPQPSTAVESDEIEISDEDFELF